MGVGSINIQRQCEQLYARLEVEALTSKEINKEKIQTFRANKKGKALEHYLKEKAWIEDQKGITKVYLVKDADHIVFFFALSAGLLYQEIGSEDKELSEAEKEIIEFCVEAYLKGNEKITTDEVFPGMKTSISIRKNCVRS